MTRSAASLLAILAVSTSAFADDLSPPPWRFGAGTTVQHWDFSAGPAGGVPDALPLFNPYGAGPLLSPLAPAAWFPNLMGRNHVWNISAGGGGGLDFFVPNTGNSANQKELWLQLTYWVPVPAGPPGVQVTSGSGPFTQISSQITALPGGWFHELSVWTVPICPQKEVVHIFPQGVVSYIDQVVIDTRCYPVPTPSAAATLALGGLVAVRRRRR